MTDPPMTPTERLYNGAFRRSINRRMSVPGLHEYLWATEDRMRTALGAELTYMGRRVDTSAGAFGELRTSTDILHDVEALRRRASEDGYLFLPGLLDRDEVIESGREILRRLGAAGFLDPAFPVPDGIPAPDVRDGFVPQLARDNPSLEKVIFHGPMMSFYERFLGGSVRHFDFVWLRAKRPGNQDATPPHYDVVSIASVPELQKKQRCNPLICASRLASRP